MGSITDPVRKWLFIGRWWSFYTDFIAVSVGSVLALPRFNMLLYGLMLAGTISMNAFANFMNDIYDFRHGEWDRKKAKVRNPNPITEKLVSEGALWNASATALVIAALCGSFDRPNKPYKVPYIFFVQKQLRLRSIMRIFGSRCDSNTYLP